MNSRDASLIVVAAAALAGAAWWTMRPEPPVEKPGKVKHSPLKKEAVKVRSDLDWNSVSGEEIRAYASYFGGAKDPHSFDIDTVVSPGESILADVYEAAPGEFVFSKLSVVPVVHPEDSYGFDVALDSFSISISEGHKNIFRNVTGHVPRRGDTSIVTFIGDGLYWVNVAAKLDGDSPAIHIKADGKYELTKPDGNELSSSPVPMKTPLRP